jgi:hypothetical protein
MYRGFGFDRVIFCVRDITNSKMVARFGLGENAEEIVKRFQFPISKSTDVFNIAVSQSKGILIDDAKAPSIARTFPEWYRETLEASSFVIYPLACKGSCIGMFYADRRKREILMTDEQKSHMESLRSMAIQAITQKGG